MAANAYVTVPMICILSELLVFGDRTNLSRSWPPVDPAMSNSISSRGLGRPRTRSYRKFKIRDPGLAAVPQSEPPPSPCLRVSAFKRRRRSSPRGVSKKSPFGPETRLSRSCALIKYWSCAANMPACQRPGTGFERTRYIGLSTRP